MSDLELLIEWNGYWSEFDGYNSLQNIEIAIQDAAELAMMKNFIHLKS